MPKQIVALVLLLLSAVVASAETAQAAQTAPAQKQVVIFGQKIRYVEAGSGPAVILLHGLGGSSQSWTFTVAPLAEKFLVIVPDQSGFGTSD